MTINSVSGQVIAKQAQGLEKKPVEEAKQDVSFWSSDWNAGNLVRETIGWDALANWLDDSDKACTDGKDDGKLGIGETLEHLGKGFAGLVKGALNHPIATGVAIAAGVGATIATGGAILPVLAAAGGTIGAGMIGVGAYNAATAETDAEAKQAWETIGTGVFTVGASAVSAKPALDAASKAGVTSAQGAEDMNVAQAFVQTFKSTPEALKMSGVNTKANITSLMTGEMQINSNAWRTIENEKNAQIEKIAEELSKETYLVTEILGQYPNETPPVLSKYYLFNQEECLGMAQLKYEGRTQAYNELHQLLRPTTFDFRTKHYTTTEILEMANSIEAGTFKTP